VAEDSAAELRGRSDGCAGIRPALDFFRHISLREDKTPHFKTIREELRINPGRAYACGDEKKDFVAATSTGTHPFIVSYGFEDYERLTAKIGVPPELISRAPDELGARVLNALDLAA
jgi:phosphoglycolate phosphatase